MPKQAFNEAERFVVRHWEAARLLEESMEAVREKYRGLWQKVTEAVKSKHPELDLSKVRVTQFWTKGYVFSSRTVWPGTKDDRPGFYIANLRLEVIASDDEPPPSASIWIKPARKAGLDPVKARNALVSAAKKLLTPEEHELCLKQPGDEDSALSYDLPETRQQLLEMLVDEDGQRFVDCMVSHIDLLARFVPVLDEILLKGE